MKTKTTIIFIVCVLSFGILLIGCNTKPGANNQDSSTMSLTDTQNTDHTTKYMPSETSQTETFKYHPIQAEILENGTICFVSNDVTWRDIFGTLEKEINDEKALCDAAGIEWSIKVDNGNRRYDIDSNFEVWANYRAISWNGEDLLSLCKYHLLSTNQFEISPSFLYYGKKNVMTNGLSANSPYIYIFKDIETAEQFISKRGLNSKIHVFYVSEIIEK